MEDPKGGITEMTQDERWQIRYQEVIDFIEKNHRNPSKHRLEEHDMLNWLKANRKKMNAGDYQTYKRNIAERLKTYTVLADNVVERPINASHYLDIER